MSQMRRQSGKYEIVYGEDHLDGLFFQVFEGENLVEAGDKASDPSLNIEKIAEIVEDYGFDLSDEVPEGIIE